MWVISYVLLLNIEVNNGFADVLAVHMCMYMKTYV